MAEIIEKKIKDQIASLEAREIVLFAELEKIAAQLEILRQLDSDPTEQVSGAEVNADSRVMGEARRRPKKSKKPIHWPSLMDEMRKSGKSFTTQNVLEALVRKGVLANRKSVRSRLGEYVQSGSLLRIEDGVFQFSN